MKMHKSDEKSDSGTMNVSSYPMIDSNKWDFFADATYWRAEQDGTEWASRNIDANSQKAEKHLRKVEFDWTWGFKVGVGYNMMKHDEWDTQLTYTWFHVDEHDRVGIAKGATPTDTACIESVYTDSTLTYKDGDTRWKIDFNMFDWELGRGYMVSKHFALRPHIGVKGGWIHQKDHGHFQSAAGVNTTYEAKNHFWGVGPSAGFNTKWEIGNYGTHFFSLFGDFAGAWMYGYWDVEQQNVQNLSRNLGAFMVQSFMGMGWDTNFSNNQAHFSMRLGYEVQQWFNQLKFSPFNGSQRYNYDLSFQGGTLDFRFDF